MRPCVLAGLAALTALSSGAGPATKKFIGTGWDTLRVSPEEVLANAPLFADSGLDGISLAFVMKGAGGERLAFDTVFSSTAFKYDDLKHYVPVFRKIAAAPGLAESLLTVWWTPRPSQRLKWDDDGGWGVLANNMGVMAKLAREGGLKGLFLDWEDYGGAHQFERTAADPESAETLRLARRRGREIGKAVFSEFPDVRFFSYWWLCANAHVAAYQASEREYALRNYVWGAFVNGLLDVMPDEAQLIDGREHYHLESARRDFYKNAADIQIACQALVAPENRAKYRRVLSVSFGHYLDMYVNDESESRWYFGPEGGSRLEHFRRNVEQAARAATEYVWIYGEKGLFVPFEGCANGWIARQKTWESLLPGWVDAVKGVKGAWRVEGVSPAKRRTRPAAAPAMKTGGGTDAQEELPKKFLACGAAIAKLTPKELLAQAAAFAASGFDGVAVSIDVTDAIGHRLGSEGIASRTGFPAARFRPFIADLKAMAETPGLKESLLAVNPCPEAKDRLPWGSEKRWSTYVSNMALMAKLAKASGLKGLFLDSRDLRGARQFVATDKDRGYGYDALVREAGRRGREVGKAVFAAYPDIVLFSTRWFSAEASVAESPGATKEARSLWPAFVNGILAAMPANVKFVDGCTGASDSAKRGYYKVASDTFAAGRILADEGNAAKLLKALSLSSGDALSRYVSAKDTAAFWRNLDQASAVSAEYVWLDVGTNAVTDVGADALDRRLPGWRDVVLQVKDERAWIRSYLGKGAASAKDLVRDSACANGVGGGFFAYIDRKSAPHAVIDTDRTVGEGDSTSFRMKGCGLDGTLMFQVLGVKPGDAYIVQFSTKGYPVAAKASWREDSKFRWNVPSVTLPVSVENAAGWRTASRIVRAPEMDGYNEMYLMIDMRNSGTEDVSWVDNVHVYKIKD